MSERFIDRLDFTGDLAEPLNDVCLAFGLGKYLAQEPITIGYEDFNTQLETSEGSYFAKIFTKDRTDEECERYVRVMQAVVDSGVNHPGLKIAKSGAIYRPNGTNLRVSVTEWLESSQDFQRDKPSDEQLAELIRQTALINQLDVGLTDADFIYDSWAISSFVNEFEKWQHVLGDDDKKLIDPVLAEYCAVDVDGLPKAFVHGDLIRTNVMQTAVGLYVYDFAVANIYPRVQELAVLLCDMFFSPESEAETFRLYGFLLSEYQEYVPLTDKEIEALPVFVRAAHAMHILGGARGEKQGDGGEENDLWWNLGRAGLRMNAYSEKL